MRLHSPFPLTDTPAGSDVVGLDPPLSWGSVEQGLSIRGPNPFQIRKAASWRHRAQGDGVQPLLRHPSLGTKIPGHTLAQGSDPESSGAACRGLG